MQKIEFDISCKLHLAAVLGAMLNPVSWKKIRKNINLSATEFAQEHWVKYWDSVNSKCPDQTGDIQNCVYHKYSDR